MRATQTLRDDRGSASVSIVILLPLALLMFFICVQVIMLSHARSVATAAAQEGVAAARVLGGTPADAVAAANQILAISGHGVIGSPQVQTSADPDTITVRVTGHARLVIPGVEVDIDQSATGTLERYSAP